VVFSSFSFLALFLPLFLIVYRIAPASWRNAVILVFSWIFYAWWRLDFLPLLIFISAWAWLAGLIIERSTDGNRKLALAIAITGLLGALGWFKYANLFVHTFASIGVQIDHWQNILLPIGLSFFVFGAISYVVDVYRGVVRAERDIVTYAAYQAVFPHLVAGPIIRYASIADDLHYRAFDGEQFRAGVERFMIALAQKILLADTIAPLVNSGFSLTAPSMADAWLATFGFALQLYFDFSAYSGMAIGLGLMIGLKFPENFDNPYWSRSVTEFWRRWHMTLSSWLRDYLYISLGGNRAGAIRTYVNLMLTMALGGLWHGASWTFMLWGIWHGGGLVVERLWKNARLPNPARGLSFGLTMIFVLLGWTLFRADDWPMAAAMFAGMLGHSGLAVSQSYAAAIRPTELLTLALGLIVIYVPLVQFRSRRVWHGVRVSLSYAAFALFLASCWALHGRTVVPFLYFQF
jgi:alginate O-acetyltransferase complex protein AlgI